MGTACMRPDTDPALVAGIYIGPSFVAGKDIPQIGHVVGNQSLRGSSRATLWAYDIVSAYPIDRVWCVVVPPGHNPDPANPVADLPMLDLTYNATSGRYEAAYSGFTRDGDLQADLLRAGHLGQRLAAAAELRDPERLRGAGDSGGGRLNQ